VRKIVQITVLVFLLAGCGSLNQGWNNFTAYFNTYYNAKKFYNSGLEKNQNQQPDINPLVPIRIHESPTDAGLEDFAKAIEKGSAILREHDDSKYVVPALFIIGKSYYYRSDFFAALEKFEELDALAEGVERQEAIFGWDEPIWKCRILTRELKFWNSNWIAKISGCPIGKRKHSLY
jgi:hypothetical protein